MREIFISYRREDSYDAAGRIHDWLDYYFGPAATFRDIDLIDSGVHFPTRLEEALNECKVVLAIIGPRWLTIKDAQGRVRIHSDEDWVRQEIVRAMAHGKKVIPIRVTNAPQPHAADVPPDLAEFCRISAGQIRPDHSFQSDIKHLIERISDLTGLLPDNYPAALADCRRLGLVAASVALMSQDTMIVDAIDSATNLTIAMNDGRNFLFGLQEKIARRCIDPEKTTRVLLHHPRSKSLGAMIIKNGKRRTVQLDEISSGVMALQKRVADITAGQTPLSAIDIRGANTYFPSSYVVTERYVFISPYLCGERGALPILKIVKIAGVKSCLYKELADDIEEVFKRSKPITRADFNSFRLLFGRW